MSLYETVAERKGFLISLMPISIFICEFSRATDIQKPMKTEDEQKDEL